MLLAIIATAATIASKFLTASAIGPIVHQFIVGAFNGSNASSNVLLLSADCCVTVSKDEQSCVAETLVEVSESKEMVQPVPRAMVQYEPSSKVVANLSNEPIGKSFFDTLAKEFSSAMIIFTILATWYRSRIFIMMQSAMRMFLETAHGCTNQKKEFTEATRVIQMKIYLLVASAINRWKEIIHSLLGPLLLIGAEVNVEQRLCGISAAGTALIRAMRHLAVLFAVAKGVSLEYKSSRPHLPGMKQFTSMLLVLLIGLLTMSGYSRNVHPIISRSSTISSYDAGFSYDTTGFSMGLAATPPSAVPTGLSYGLFLPGAVLFNDDHLSTEPTRSGLLDTQSLSTAFVSNEDLMALNVGLLDENDQSLCMSVCSAYDDGLVFLPQTDLDTVTSTALSLDWNAFDCIHLTRSMNASGTAHSSLIMICTLDLASDRVDVVSFHGFVSECYVAVIVVKQFDIYTMSAIVVVASGFDPYHILTVELPAYSPLSSEAAEGTSNAPMFAKLSTPEEAIPYLSESNDDELSFHKALPVQLEDRNGSSSVASHQSWNSTSYKVSASTQREVAISSVLFHQPQPGIDPFTLVRWLPRPASSLMKALNILNTWELRHLVLMVLLLVVHRDSDTNTDHPEEVHSTSNSLSTNSQDTPENEVLFDDQGDEAEESLTTVSHKHKHVSRESTALRSDLGRHWNSSPKRRCRRSPRKRRKVTRYQPM